MGIGQSSSVKSSASEKEIVVVGAGYGGAYLAHKLVVANVGKVTLIDPKESMFHSLGALRTAVDEKYENKLCIPFNFKLSQSHIQGKASGLDSKNKTLTLTNGKTVKYTDLVIATGTRAPFPGKFGEEDETLTTEQILQMYSDIRKEIRTAKSVVLVGGGAVGVEMAGEIKTDFPEKKVTIVNSRDFLVTHRGKPSFQKSLRNAIKKKNIEILLNERVSNLNELIINKSGYNQIVKTEKGKEINCDLVILCTGNKLNNRFFKDELADAVNENGALMVNEYLEVKNHHNIYAIGDITAIPEEKMAVYAKAHADAVYETLRGKPKKYQPDPDDFMMVVPLGRNGGVGQFKGIVWGDFFCKKAKSESLMATNIWKDLNMKVPK